ncbi:helix-turn-helix domain-containing protein [Corynebacterium variabile]|uniref:helix-turn-helix domain-containing protein n=1 Tax=Corynebacterium variabile TaxID=1727 RepID=UPI003CE5A8EC
MAPQTLMSTEEVASRLGIDRSTVTRRVIAGTLPAMGRLPGRTGAYLFDPDTIAALKGKADHE